jgi:hypothetical protein
VTRRPKPAPPKRRFSRQNRLRLNKVYAGIADFARNLGLLFIAAILVDMLVGQPRPRCLSLANGDLHCHWIGAVCDLTYIGMDSGGVGDG